MTSAKFSGIFEPPCQNLQHRDHATSLPCQKLAKPPPQSTDVIYTWPLMLKCYGNEKAFPIIQRLNPSYPSSQEDEEDRMRRLSSTLIFSNDLMSLISYLLCTNRQYSSDSVSFWIRPPSQRVSASPTVFSRRTRENFLYPSPNHTKNSQTGFTKVLTFGRGLFASFPARKAWERCPRIVDGT